MGPDATTAMKRAGSTSSLSSVAAPSGKSGPTRLEETPPTREAKVVKPGAKQKPRPVASPLNAVAPVEEEAVEGAPTSWGTPKKNLGSVFAAAEDVHAVSSSPVKSPDMKKTKTVPGSSMLCDDLPQWPISEASNDAEADAPKEAQDALLVPGMRDPKQQQCLPKAVPEEPQNSVSPSRRHPKQQECLPKAVPEEPQNSVSPSRRDPKQQQCLQKAVPKEPQQVSEHPAAVDKQQKVSARIDTDSQRSMPDTEVQESPSEFQQNSQGAVSWLAC